MSIFLTLWYHLVVICTFKLNTFRVMRILLTLPPLFLENHGISIHKENRIVHTRNSWPLRFTWRVLGNCFLIILLVCFFWMVRWVFVVWVVTLIFIIIFFGIIALSSFFLLEEDNLLVLEWFSWLLIQMFPFGNIFPNWAKVSLVLIILKLFHDFSIFWSDISSLPLLPWVPQNCLRG